MQGNRALDFSWLHTTMPHCPSTHLFLLYEELIYFTILRLFPQSKVICLLGRKIQRCFGPHLPAQSPFSLFIWHYIVIVYLLAFLPSQGSKLLEIRTVPLVLIPRHWAPCLVHNRSLKNACWINEWTNECINKWRQGWKDSLVKRFLPWNRLIPS